MLEDCYSRLPEKFKPHQMVYSISVYYDISEKRAINILKAMEIFGWLRTIDMGWFKKVREVSKKEFVVGDIPEFSEESAKDEPKTETDLSETQKGETE